MNRKALVLLLVVLVALPTMSLAKDLTQKFALGFSTSDAPVGIRYWAAEKVALDLGLGFQSQEVADPEGEAGETTNTMSFWIDLGVPYKVVDFERAHFFVRPGALIALLDDRAYGSGGLDETWTVINFNLGLGAEVFLTDQFSVDAMHGFIVRYTSPPDDIGDSTTDFGTFGASITEVGFHFYF